MGVNIEIEKHGLNHERLYLNYSLQKNLSQNIEITMKLGYLS